MGAACRHQSCVLVSRWNLYGCCVQTWVLLVLQLEARYSIQFKWPGGSTTLRVFGFQVVAFLHDGLCSGNMWSPEESYCVFAAISMSSVVQLMRAARSTSCSLAAVFVRSLTTGTAYTLTKVFSQSDASEFVRLTGDSNPIHVDRAAASAASLEHPILPGMLLASMFPAIIGSHFPGALYLKQTLKFRRPAVVGSTVTAEVRVSARSGQRVTFDTVCKNDSGLILLDGTALALIKA